MLDIQELQHYHTMPLPSHRHCQYGVVNRCHWNSGSESEEQEMAIPKGNSKAAFASKAAGRWAA